MSTLIRAAPTSVAPFPRASRDLGTPAYVRVEDGEQSSLVPRPTSASSLLISDFPHTNETRHIPQHAGMPLQWAHLSTRAVLQQVRHQLAAVART